jgi:Na+/H+ antiporter 1
MSGVRDRPDFCFGECRCSALNTRSERTWNVYRDRDHAWVGGGQTAWPGRHVLADGAQRRGGIARRGRLGAYHWSRCRAGLGFTMSLFIATLAFGESELLESAKLGILGASLVSGVLGSILLRRIR